MNNCQCQECYKQIIPGEPYKRIEDHLFCGMDCLTDYLNMEERFREAADNFSPKKHTEKRWWGSNQPMAGTTNPEDM